MKRQEIMAIIGAYSRQGFNVSSIPGGFLLTGNGNPAVDFTFRTAREARKDTGIDMSRINREIYRGAVNFDLR